MAREEDHEQRIRALEVPETDRWPFAIRGSSPIQTIETATSVMSPAEAIQFPDDFFTSDQLVFAEAGDTGIQILVPGFYLFKWWVDWNPPFVARTRSGPVTSADTGGAAWVLPFGICEMPYGDVMTDMMLHYFDPDSTADEFHLQVAQMSGIDRTCTAKFYMARVGFLRGNAAFWV